MAMYGEKARTMMKFTITSFPSVTLYSLIWPTNITIFPSKPTKGVSYLVRSSSFSPSPLYKLGYMISALLLWLIISLFMTNPQIQRVTTNASSCGYIVPSRSSSSKALFSLPILAFFSSWLACSNSCYSVMLITPLHWRIATLVFKVACMTLIISRGGGITFPWLPNAYPKVPTPWLTTYSFKWLALVNCFKWSLKVLHCSVVFPFSRW